MDNAIKIIPEKNACVFISQVDRSETILNQFLKLKITKKIKLPTVVGIFLTIHPRQFPKPFLAAKIMFLFIG